MKLKPLPKEIVMNKTTSISIDSSIRVAKEDVDSSVKRFEMALGQLANKVEDSAQKIQHVKDIANKPKDLVINLKNRAVWVTQTVQKNPAPYLVAAAGIAGAVGLVLWVRSQKYHWEFPKDIGI